MASISGDDKIRAKIIQLLFTRPGERTNMPYFGCGLSDLVYAPDSIVLAAKTEYTVRKSLERWLGNEILVETVNVESEEEYFLISIVYIRKDTREKQEVEITVEKIL